MMKRLFTKLRSRLKGKAGESLAEVLFAVLIAALALTMLASVISTASNIIQQNRARTEEYYDANNSLDQRSDPDGTLTIHITSCNASGSPLYDDIGHPLEVKLKNGSGAISVNYYENTELAGKSVISY